MAHRTDDELFLTQFHNRFDANQPLDPGDSRYVTLDGSDPEHAPRGERLVPLLLRTITRSSEETTQLISGFRGTGKTTELRWLARELRDQGYLVLSSDARDYLNLTEPVEISERKWASSRWSGKGSSSPSARSRPSASASASSWRVNWAG